MRKILVINGQKFDLDNIKKFIESDLVTQTYRKIYVDNQKTDLIENPLWYHKQNLMQTASGYGSKLTTSKMIYFENKLRRIYCTIYSNS